MKTKIPTNEQENELINASEVEPTEKETIVQETKAEAEVVQVKVQQSTKAQAKKFFVQAAQVCKKTVTACKKGCGIVHGHVSKCLGIASKYLKIAREKQLRASAHIDCATLRLWYHTKRFVIHAISRLVHAFISVKVLHLIGDFFYAMGFQTEYRLILLGRLCKKTALFLVNSVFAQISRVAKIIWREIVIVWRELFRPFYVLGRGIYRVFAHGAKVTKERNAFFGFFSAIAYLFRGLFRYVHVLPGMVSYVLPFIALAGFWMVIENTMAQEYTLEVSVNGEVIGYVENEMVFENAKDDVQERVEYAASNASTWTISPTYTLSTKAATLTEDEMADAILFASSEEISEATAVYIDGELRLITNEGDELQAYLDSLTAPYEDDEDPTLVLSFNKEIELVEGIYFTETFTAVDEIIEYFSGLEAAQVNYTVVSGDSWSLIASKNGLTQAEIFAMNPGMSADTAIYPGDQIIIGLEKAVLEVYVCRTIEYDESIAYSTVKTESSDYSFGTTQVTQYGADGVRHITATVTYDTDGNVLNTEIISSEITLEAVDQIEVVGTYLSSGMIANVGSGTFIWPVPNYTYVSRWASSSHDGVDICGPAGTAIYAADDGVVIKAGYNAAGTGYGYSIVIDHGNGYQTLYAHGLSVAVSVGDVVTQGQYIMPMGSTGYSSGNHLHWEVTNNGNLIWPQNIFSSSYY